MDSLMINFSIKSGENSECMDCKWFDRNLFYCLDNNYSQIYIIKYFGGKKRRIIYTFMIYWIESLFLENYPVWSDRFRCSPIDETVGIVMVRKLELDWVNSALESHIDLLSIHLNWLHKLNQFIKFRWTVDTLLWYCWVLVTWIFVTVFLSF